MNRTEKIKLLARQNKIRHALPIVRGELSHILGDEIADQDFLDETQAQETSDYYFARFKEAHEINQFIFRRHYLPDSYVVQNQDLFANFGMQTEEEIILLRCWNKLYWWLRVKSNVFSRFQELSQLEYKEYYLSDAKIENGFLLVQQKLYFFDGRRENNWTLEVFGEKWSNLAVNIF